MQKLRMFSKKYLSGSFLKKKRKNLFFHLFSLSTQQKIVLMRIDPYSSPMMLMIISDGKNEPKTHENSHIW